jgi:hypothetical protein
MSQRVSVIEQGPLDVCRDWLRLLAMKTVTTFYRRMVLVVRPIDPIPDLQPRLPVILRVLSKEDIPAYRIFQPNQSVKEIDERFERGDCCFAAFHEGRIVTAGWVTTNRIYVPYLRRDLILLPGDIYVYNYYTLPEYRGNNVGVVNGLFIRRYYKKEGYSRSVALIAAENRAGSGLVKSAGYRSVGLYACLRLGFWQWDWQRTWTDEPLPALGKKIVK